MRWPECAEAIRQAGRAGSRSALRKNAHRWSLNQSGSWALPQRAMATPTGTSTPQPTRRSHRWACGAGVEGRRVESAAVGTRGGRSDVSGSCSGASDPVLPAHRHQGADRLALRLCVADGAGLQVESTLPVRLVLPAGQAVVSAGAGQGGTRRRRGLWWELQHRGRHTRAGARMRG